MPNPNSLFMGSIIEMKNNNPGQRDRVFYIKPLWVNDKMWSEVIHRVMLNFNIIMILLEPIVITFKDIAAFFKLQECFCSRMRKIYSQLPSPSVTLKITIIEI